MSRKPNYIHYIYKTTCLITKRFYIGMHSTNNINDNYMGSGTRIRYSFKKYGKNNHIKEILEYCENREVLSKREREIITKELIQEELCINLTTGGLGAGFMNDEHQFKCSQAAGVKHRERLLNDEEYRKKYSLKISEANKTRIIRGDFKTWKETYSWLGKKHKESSKKLIGETNSIKQKGENNSQFGTCWITNGVLNKKIKKTELDYYLNDGWGRGVKSKIKGELVKNSKLTIDDVIKIKHQLFYEKLSNSEISKEFKVVPQTIYKIKHGITWSHIIID